MNDIAVNGAVFPPVISIPPHVGSPRMSPPLTPNLIAPLDDYQIEQLLNKVNLNNSFLNLATTDLNLINMMKEQI